MKILMVCLGNICRSPMAQGVMQHLIQNEGLNWEIDSAGTGAYHIGQQPDLRAIDVASRNGINLKNLRARKFNKADFKNFDHIFVMDKKNYADVLNLTNEEKDKNKVQLFITDGEVQDPYFDDALFQPVFETITAQCEKLLKDLKKENE